MVYLKYPKKQIWKGSGEPLLELPDLTWRNQHKILRGKHLKLSSFGAFPSGKSYRKWKRQQSKPKPIRTKKIGNLGEIMERMGL